MGYANQSQCSKSPEQWNPSLVATGLRQNKSWLLPIRVLEIDPSNLNWLQHDFYKSVYTGLYFNHFFMTWTINIPFFLRLRFDPCNTNTFSTRDVAVTNPDCSNKLVIEIVLPFLFVVYTLCCALCATHRIAILACVYRTGTVWKKISIVSR